MMTQSSLCTDTELLEFLEVGEEICRTFAWKADRGSTSIIGTAQ